MRLRSQSVQAKNNIIPQRVRDTEEDLLKSAKDSARRGSMTAMSKRDEMPLPQSGIGSTAGSTAVNS